MIGSCGSTADAALAAVTQLRDRIDDVDAYAGPDGYPGLWFGITHNDLHGCNIMVDSRSFAWLIDYGEVLRDKQTHDGDQRTRAASSSCTRLPLAARLATASRWPPVVARHLAAATQLHKLVTPLSADKLTLATLRPSCAKAFRDADTDREASPSSPRVPPHATLTPRRLSTRSCDALPRTRMSRPTLMRLAR